MAKTNIPVQELEFSKIKQNLKEFLKGQDQFQDYDFEGSAMNVHLDLLAYTTHYMGFYAHMLNNESNIDSAVLKSSLNSKGKTQGYVPGSKKSAQATVSIIAQVDGTNEPSDRKIVIPRGTTIKSNNNATDSRSFVLIDDLYIYNRATEAGQYAYSSDDLVVYEGTFDTEQFTVDESLINQRFIIRNKDIDLSTLRIRVFDSQGDENFIPFKRVEDFMSVDRESAVYFVTMNEDGYYELQFGNDVYGRKLSNGNFIECTYVSSSGVSGNNARQFTFGGPFNYDGTDYGMVVITKSYSQGGMEPESTEDLRFNIPNHFREQKRAVIEDDYQSLLMREYRNINSINVWGGEKNVPKAYGKIFVCIKPLYGEVLSSKAKENIIKDIIKPRNVTVIEVEIVDPEYLYLNLDVRCQYNPIKTDKSTGEVVSDALAAIDTYNVDYLNRFGSYYSDQELNSVVKNSNPAILTSYSKITMEKRFIPALDTSQTTFVDFANPIVPGTVVSNEFEYRLFRCKFMDDDQGKIRIWYKDTSIDEYVMFPDEEYGEVDYAGGVVRLTEFMTTGLYGKTELGVHAKPENPDFFTERNNIVVIEDSKVTMTENFGNR